MKKILIILMILACLFIFSGCNNPITEASNRYGYFVEIINYSGIGSDTDFMYDPITKIVYVEISGGYHAGFSPYYTIKHGEPVIAIYGMNWTETDIMKGTK